MKVNISYKQLAIFNSSLENPYNDWTDEHIAQGFSWRPNSVSFDTIEDGEFELTIKQIEEFDSSKYLDAIRVIKVPFTVADNLEIGSVVETSPLEIDKGEISVIFALLPNHKIDLLFINSECEPEIILMNDQEKPLGKLLMEALSA